MGGCERDAQSQSMPDRVLAWSQELTGGGDGSGGGAEEGWLPAAFEKWEPHFRARSPIHTSFDRKASPAAGLRFSQTSILRNDGKPTATSSADSAGSVPVLGAPAGRPAVLELAEGGRRPRGSNFRRRTASGRGGREGAAIRAEAAGKEEGLGRDDDQGRLAARPPARRCAFPARARASPSGRAHPSPCADAHFAELGSTQNRNTTWQPHHTLHRPPTPVSLTQSHLVAAGAHLGHSPSLTHRAAIPLIYGTRSSLSYIDLRQTLPALRRAAQIVRGVVERDGIVVFVGSLKGAERAVWENAKRLGENGYGVTKWLPGTISNAKEVFGWCEIPEVEGEWKKASALSFKPSLVVLLSPTLNQHAVREATMNEVPTIGICDTDVDPRCVTYSIPANDDSPRAIELIAGVLGMAGRDGLERKLARCVFPHVLAQGRR